MLAVEGVDASSHGEPGAHLREMRPQAGGLTHHHGVQVHRLVASLPDDFHDLFQQQEAGDILEGRVMIREVAAQVTGAHGAQEGVADGVAQDVGIGMPQQA